MILQGRMQWHNVGRINLKRGNGVTDHDASTPTDSRMDAGKGKDQFTSLA